MIAEKYQANIRRIAKKHLKKDVRVFVFGSAVSGRVFNDIDLGLIEGKINKKEMNGLINDLEESNLPYKIDVIDFNKVKEDFKENVFRNKVLWLI